MTSSSHECRFNKFGHCKFKEKCRNIHFYEVCHETECDISKCNKRHPRACRFFHENRCKFSESCSFSHNISQYDEGIHEDKLDMKSLLETLKDTIKVQSTEIAALKSRIDALEQENGFIKKELVNVNVDMKAITEKVISDTITAVMEKLHSHQDQLEIKSNLQFDALNQQLSSLVSLINLQTQSKPSTSNALKPQMYQREDDSLKHYPNSCDKSYTSKSAVQDHQMMNHNKKNPKFKDR